MRGSKGRERRERKVPAVATSEVQTPIRAALRPESRLQVAVRDGLGAVESGHRDYLEEKIRTQFADSLELDAAMADAYPQDNRWDYLLGHAPSGCVIAVEPHSAKSDQVSTVIAKRTKAQAHLREHLRPGAKIAEWIWVASGRVDFSPFDRIKRQLDEKGIRFVGGQMKQKDLSALPAALSR